MKDTKFAIIVFLCFIVAVPALAQDADASQSVISASATGRVEIDADYAVLTLGVLIQDSTPTLAAREMDRRLRNLTDTLLSMGFPAESLPTAHYHVSPSRDRDRVRVVGYAASAAVRLTIWELGRIASVIEAALAVGATDVTGLHFAATDEREARDEALRRALAEALRDATVLAEAAGGRLGDPVEITTMESRRLLTRAAAYVDAARALELSAEINPGAIVVEATVTGRWVFEEN